MAIYELEPRVKIGPLKIGRRLGKELREHELVGISERFDDSRSRRLLHSLGLWKRPSIEDGMEAFILSANSLRVYNVVDNYPDHYGISELGCNLTARSINLHPFVSRKLYWVS